MEHDLDCFTRYFKQFVLSIDSKANLNQQPQFFEEISSALNSQKNVSDVLIEKLALIGISKQTQMNDLLFWMEDINRMFNDFDAKIAQSSIASQLSQEYIKQTKQQLCFQRQYFKNSEILKKLQTNFEITLKEPTVFFKKMDSLINVNDFYDFKYKAGLLLTEQYEDFKTYEQQTMQEVFDLLYKKNLSFKKLSQILECSFEDNLLEKLNSVYNNDNIQANNPETQSKSRHELQEQFIKRVQSYLLSTLNVFVKKIIRGQKAEQKSKNMAMDLYKERSLLNRMRVLQILKNSGVAEFKDTSKIKEQLLIKIYNLKSIDQMDFQEQTANFKDNSISKNKEIKQIKSLKKQNKIQQKSSYSKNQKSYEVNNKKSINQKSSLKQKIRNYSPNNSSLKQKQSKLLKQDSKQRSNQDQTRIDIIKAQIQRINKQIGATCLQIKLRELQLNTITNNIENITTICKELSDMIVKYNLGNQNLAVTQEIKMTSLSKSDRIPKVYALRRGTEHLNLEQIFQGAQYFELNKDCQNSDAIFFLGFTGTGKTTTMNGCMGNELVFNVQTKDYQPSDPEMAKRFKVSSNTMSETRWANIGKIPLIFYDKSKQTIYVIDLPGLMDNRSAQTDITNNLGTVNLLKTLKSGRVVLVLSQKQFGDRWYEGLQKMVSVVSNYLVNIDRFEKSITLILTKGLCKQRLADQLQKFVQCEAYQKQNWTDNQKQFIAILRQQVQQLEEQNQIVNPSQHDFKRLVKVIMKTRGLQMPGNYIASSFSTQASRLIRQTFSYLEKQVQMTASLGQFESTLFYLKRIQQLEKISASNSYKNATESLRKMFQKKIRQVQISIQKYLNHNILQQLVSVKKTFQFLSIFKAKQIFSIIYSSDQKNPRQSIQLIIDDNLKQANQMFQKPSLIPREKRKIALGLLNLIKQFKSETQYQVIVNKINNQNVYIENEMNEILKKAKFNEAQWKDIVVSFKNQFTLNKVVLNQMENYEHIKNIALKYINSNPKELSSMNALIEAAKTDFVDGKLYENATLFLKKLNKISQTHFSIKSVIQPKIKEINQKFDNLIVYFEQQKSNSIQNLDLKIIELWDKFQQNKNEVYQILEESDSSLMLGFKNQKQQESTMQSVLNHLADLTQRLDKNIQNLSLKPDQIEPSQIGDTLKNIFALIQFIKKRKNAKSKNQQSIISRNVQYMVESIEKAYKTLKRIIHKIERVNTFAKIENYQLNFKLIVCLVILKQFAFYSEQEEKQQINGIQKEIQKKLLQPLEEIKTVEFVNEYDFEKANKILQYLKELDIKSTKLGSKAKGYNFSVKFSNNPDILKILQKSFTQIKSDFQKFTSIIFLSQFNTKLTLDEDHQLLRTEKQKSLKHLSFNLLNSAVQYVLSFNNIKATIKQFSKDISIVNDFMKTDLKNLDLKSIVITRMKAITDDIQNPNYTNSVEKEELSKLQRQFTFLTKLHQGTKLQPNQQDFTQTKNQINRLLSKYLEDFMLQLNKAAIITETLQKQVDFDQMRKLIKHKGLVDGKNKTALRELLDKIDSQYKRILKEIFVGFNPHAEISQNTKVFVNIYEFIQICIEVKHPISLDKSLLENNCQGIFCQLMNSFKMIISYTKKGITCDQKKIMQLVRYERTIQIQLKQHYDKFLQKENKKPSLTAWYEECKGEADKTIFYKYIQNFEVDANLKTVYGNTTEENKVRIKKAAIQNQTKKIQEIKSLFKKDQDQFNRVFEQKLQQIELYPEQIKKQIEKTYQSLNNQKIQQQTKLKQQIKINIQKKNPFALLAQYQKGTTLKNTKVKQATKDGLKKYIQEQKKQIDFSNTDKLEQNLTRNLKFLNSENFKKASIDQEVQKIYVQYVDSVRQQAKVNTKSVEQRFVNLKNQIIELNPVQSFKLYDFTVVKSEVQVQALKLMKITEKYKIILEKQMQEVKTSIQTKIKQEKQCLQKGINMIEDAKQKILKRQVLTKKQFILILRQAHTNRQTYANLKVLNQIDSIKCKVEQTIIDIYDKTICDLRTNLKNKYLQAKEWNLENSLTNDTLQRMAKQNLNFEKDLTMVDSYTEIFFNKNEVPENVLEAIQEKNKLQFDQFQKKTINEIINNFTTDTEYVCESVRKYYDFQKLFKSATLIAFPSNMQLTTRVKNTLLEKFKQNTQRIEHFSQQKLKISKFKAFMQSLDVVTKQQKVEYNQITKLYSTKYQIFHNQHKLDLQAKLKLVDNDQKKKQKSQEIRKQFQGNKNSGINDLKTEQNQEKAKLSALFLKKKDTIVKQINIFVYENLAIELIYNRRARSYYGCQEQIKKYPATLEYLLDKVQSNYTKKISRYLFNCLKDSPNSISQQLIQEEKMFSQFRALQFQDLAKGQTFEKLVLSVPDLVNVPNKKNRLFARFKEYNETYESILQGFRNSNDLQNSKQHITAQIINMGDFLKNQYQHNKKSKVDIKRWILLAYIFAFWTILKAELDQDKQVIFIHRPHPGQILALFLLLEFDQDKQSNKISKTMVQVSTGQGKSVILGALSTYLALVGFSVYQACYSKYLSYRDYKDFEYLFICLKVHRNIRYDIFPEICKLMLDQSPQNPFTDKVEKALFPNNSLWEKFRTLFESSLISQHKKNSSILLIDEADVFLDETFLGQSFLPTIKIHRQSIEKLLLQIWKLRDKAASLMPKDIICLPQFKDVCAEIKNPIWERFMENQTNAMIRDLASYKGDVYTLGNGKIFYKEGDGLSDKIHYGYRTIWAYFHQHFINKRVSINELTKQMVINPAVAAFSYSKLPQYFNSILGVTGTLVSMSDGQQQILRNDFGVKKQFVQPSIYPPSNRDISFQRCYNLKLYEEIVKNITLQHKKKRPIVVFFKTKADVYDFAESKQFTDYKNKSTIITYEVQPETRDFRIQVSTKQQKITLLTYDFSRGTDFKLKVKDSKTHPGLHVIFSFLPESFSDYIQLAGRTGRQGKNGSVHIFIIEETQVAADKMVVLRENAEQTIRQLDNKYWKSKLKQIKIKMENTNKQHARSMQLYSSGTTVDKILLNIEDLNKEALIAVYNSKTAICIDATGSMGAVFPKVLQVVQGAIPDIYCAIQEQKIQGSFELKFVIYRNYNSDNNLLLQFSNFESKSQPLVRWLNGISVSGGCGNQAVEVCFQHLNSIQQLHQCVVIADAKANTKQETIAKRASKGQEYWNKNGFSFTTYDEQLKKLKARKIKVHSYYLNPNATAEFYKSASALTEGSCQDFKINDSNATKNFADFVANKIISNLGDMVGGDAKQKLLKKYAQLSKKKKYV